MAGQNLQPSQPEAVKTQISPIFHEFPELPRELRLTIWQHAIDEYGPRIVELRDGRHKWAKSRHNLSNHHQPGTEQQSSLAWSDSWFSTCPIPSILHVCHESRRLALKQWNLALAKFPATEIAPRIFFDFTHDTVYFGKHFGHWDDFIYWILPSDTISIRHIAFELINIHGYKFYGDGGPEREESFVQHLREGLPDLRSIILTLRDLEGVESIQDARETVVSFKPVSLVPSWISADLLESLENFEEVYSRNDWTAPDIEYMHCEYAAPTAI